jgi:multisubunit Na+/H+ antiporter MnhF subunit
VNAFNGMLFGAEVLFVPMAVALYIVLSGDTIRRLIALQLVASLASIQLLLFSIVFGTDSFADVAIVMALLSTGATLAFSQFLERWL